MINRGMAINLKMSISTTHKAKNINLSLLSAQPRFLNFKAISGISETSRRLITMHKAVRNQGVSITSMIKCCSG